jgi:hypothetical protein
MVRVKARWDSKKFKEDALKKIDALVEEKKREILSERLREGKFVGNSFTRDNPLKPFDPLKRRR